MKTISREKGTVLIITSLILGVLLILGSYFLTFTITESRISRSQVTATQTYYLAEAGVNEAIWKLKNDADWKNNFETPPGCSTWSASFSKSNTLLPNSFYQVQIQNSDCARGQIIATSTINIVNGKTAQRVVKTKVFKALGTLTGDSPFLSGGTSENISISASLINLYDGNLFSNNNANIDRWSQISVFDNPGTEKVEGKALAVNNLSVSWNSTLNATASCAKNICQGNCVEEGCPPSVISMPMVDFDSDDPNSYKKKAETAQGAGQCSVLCNGIQCATNCIFTAGEFEDLLWQVGLNGTMTLNNEITYVTGLIDLKGGRRLVVNGALVADSTINIGESNCWSNKGQKDCGFDQITVNDPGFGKPSGLLTKSKINFSLYSSFQDINITGLVYANDEVRLISLPWAFNLTGGLLGRKISLTSAWAVINITLSNQIIIEGIWGGLQPPEGEKPPYSPIVTIEHWEETY
ncbi:MAG: hypothetical protein PHE52_00155 [Candidatus Pacebacteria bacterium]|nr:hypothetical protein [Candidatus Paceibacterota bacterium]